MPVVIQGLPSHQNSGSRKIKKTERKCRRQFEGDYRAIILFRETGGGHKSLKHFTKMYECVLSISECIQQPKY